MLDERVAWLGQRMASAPIPVIAVGSTCVDVTAYGRELLGRNGIHLLGGMDLGDAAPSATPCAGPRAAAGSGRARCPASRRPARVDRDAERRGPGG